MEQEQIVKSLKRQLLVERVAIAVVLLVLLGHWVYRQFGNAPYAVVVNNRPIAFLATSDSAKKVLQTVKRKKAGTDQHVEFAQDVKVQRYRGGGPVVPESKAIEVADRKLRVRMEKWVITSDGQPVVAVDSQAMAGNVLETLKAKFGGEVKNLLEEPQFKEDVKVELTQVDESFYRRTVDEAIEQILHPKVQPSEDGEKSKVIEYEVKRGDLAVNIAKKQGLSLQKLEALNPGRNLNRLQIGDKIRISGSPEAFASEGVPKITVIVRDMVTETQRIPYTTQTISSTNMYTGKRFESQAGQNGLRKVKIAVSYENGVKKGSEILEEQVIRNPVSRRIVVGIKSR